MHYLDALDNNVMSMSKLKELHRKPGRPPRSKSASDRRISIRVTEKEFKLWTKCAGELPLGEWLRRLANRDAAL